MELQKPPPPGKPKNWNVPLLSSVGMLVMGLVVIFFSLMQGGMLVLQCAGPGLVMLGLTFMLLSILFTNKPTAFVKLDGRKRKNVRFKNK